MSANLNFLAAGFTISGNSGLGMFSSAFGNSVKVGQYQDTTYITDGNGVNQGPQTNNIKFFNGTSGYIAGGSIPTGITYIPNYLSTLQIRFSNDIAVKTQNGKLYLYDRVNQSNVGSGVTAQLAEIIHPDTVQNNTGSGNTTWTVISGIAGTTINYITLYDSPGQSGLFNNRSSTRPDTIHDFYILASLSPNNVGSKSNLGLFCSLEYL